jgi:hypothetical protein
MLEYEKKLKEIGFKKVKVYSIRKKVFGPLNKYLYKKMNEKKIMSKFGYLAQNIITSWIYSTFYSAGFPYVKFDYIIAYGEK